MDESHHKASAGFIAGASPILAAVRRKKLPGTHLTISSMCHSSASIKLWITNGRDGRGIQAIQNWLTINLASTGLSRVRDLSL